MDEPKTHKTHPKPTWLKRIVLGTLVLSFLAILLGSVTFLVAWYRFNDEALARYLSDNYNKKHRGRLVLGRVHWTPSAVLDLATGRYHRVTVTHFAIYDSRGQLVVFAPKVTARAKVWPILRYGDFIIDDAEVPDLLLTLMRYRRPDGPDIKGNRYELGLVGAFEKLRRLQRRKRKPKHRFVISVNHVKVHRLRFELGIKSVNMVVRDAKLAGSIYARSGTRTIHTDIFYDAKLTSPKTVFGLYGKTVLLSDLNVTKAKTLRSRPGELDAALSAHIGDTLLVGQATLPGLYFGPRYVNGTIKLQNAGALLASLTKGRLGGRNVQISAQTMGPTKNLAANLSVFGLRISAGPATATQVEAHVAMADKTVALQSLKAHLLRGTVTATGALALDTSRWQAKAVAMGLDTKEFLKKKNRALSGRLSGTVRASGNLKRRVTSADAIDLVYRLRHPLAGVTRTLTVTGRARLQGSNTVEVHRLNVSGGGMEPGRPGTSPARNRTLALALRLSAAKLDKLLAKFHAPALAKAATIVGDLRGHFLNPSFSGDLRVVHVGHRHPRRGHITAQVRLSDGRMSLRRIKGWLYGGWAQGNARVLLYRGRLDRPYRTPRIKAGLTLEDIVLSRMLGPRFAGRLRGGLRVSGSLKRPTGALWLRSDSILVDHKPYHHADLELALQKGDIVLEYLGIETPQNGRLRAWGSYLRNGDVNLTTQVRNLPLSALPGVGRVAPRVVSGRLSGNLSLSGSRSWPIVAGSLTMARTTIRHVFMGDAQVQIAPGANGSTITGNLFNRFTVGGRITLKPQPAVTLKMRFTNFPIEQLAPEIRKAGNATGSMTGTAVLVIGAGGLQRAELALTSLRVRFSSPSLDPTEPPRIVELTNHGAMRISFDGKRVLLDNVRLAGAGGDFKLAGWLAGSDSRLQVTGRIGLAVLPPFLPDTYEIADLTGTMQTRVRVHGPIAKPAISGTVSLKNISVALSGRTEEVHIPSGELRLSGQKDLAVQLHRLVLAIGGQKAIADGRVTLPQQGSPEFRLHLAGDISARALMVAAPESVSSATGKMRANLWLAGTTDDYNTWGSVDMGRMDLSLRGLRQAITVKSGRISFSGPKIKIASFLAEVDDGELSASGTVVYRNNRVQEMDLKLGAQNIPLSKPRVYNIEVSANLRLVGDAEGNTLSGRVDILDARYIQHFDVVRQAFLKKRVEETTEPPWKRYPLLANTELNVSVTTAGNIYIQNNIADLRLDGSVYVGGRLAHPELGGQIQVEEGTFRIPFLRGTYQVRNGNVDFTRGTEAYLTLVGETSVRDSADVEHLITLTLEGFLSKIRIDFSSDTNLPKSQILILLALGKTTDALRQQFHSKGSGSASTGSGSANPLDIYDPMIKQVSGDFLSDLVSKPIKNITRLDLFRLEFGTETFQLRVEKRLGRYFKLKGETEFGLMGRQRQEGALEGQLQDSVYIDLKGKRQITGEDVFEEEDPLQGRIQLRYRLRFRGGLFRSLGF